MGADQQDLHRKLAGRVYSAYPAEILKWVKIPHDCILEVSPVGAVLKTTTGRLGVSFDMLRRDVNTGDVLVAPGFRDRFER